jgi:predicted O-methyltransferase YrrM
LIKCVIGIPTLGPVEYDTVKSVSKLQKHGIQITVKKESSRPVSVSRNLIVKYFLEETDADYLFFVDSDTIIPDNAIELFKEDKDIISGFYPMWIRNMIVPSFVKETGDEELRFIARWKWNTVEKYAGCGAGCLLIKRHVLENMKPPWFKFELSDDNIAVNYGEDIYFGLKARSMGYDLWGHTGVICSHLKTVDLTELFKVLHSQQFGGQIMQEDQSSLFDPYWDYVTNYSESAHAMSWELTEYFQRLLKSLNPKRILDLGSGWSSYVFRTSNADVYSIDTDPKWMEVTRSFLKKYGVEDHNLYLLKDFKWEGEYDLIFHDMSIPEERPQLFKKMRDHSSGFIVVDDMQFHDYRDQVEKFFNKDIILDLLNETYDDLGRYQYAIIKRCKKWI